MRNMLPDDFRNHWIQNFIYEIYFYGRLDKFPQAMCDSRLTKSDVVTKLYNKHTVFDGVYINLYKYTKCSKKHIKEYYVKYNTMIHSYEIEDPHIGTFRYPDWARTLAVIWTL
jgi:hypothetical protein